ncbi:hypothetical protein ACE1CI_05635 [Aerosakkonemataceae cyanobacterium BLCC-F50]|uniref:Uncharacterized protein n=1 Tax=Floridaenema flaviceps BLCC-F50 TaxID=3153642 RepID=A0ABV4XL53_9CYAN
MNYSLQNQHQKHFITTKKVSIIWQQRQKLQPSDLNADQCFGNAIAISNEYAFIGGGDRFASAGIKRPGGAYIYRLENGVWKQHQKLLSPQLGTNDLFGYSVAVWGEYALVGAVNTTVSGVFGVGTVYAYKLEQGVWQLKQKLQPDRAKYCGSRPEVNNVLLSALEEKMLVLPAAAQRQEYIKVHSEFRAIFTSNPEEYCGVHETQDALMDRMVTIDIPEPDDLTQQEILVHKAGLVRGDASLIVDLVKKYRQRTQAEKSSGLRACLIIAKVCHTESIPVALNNDDFQDICKDVLLSRAKVAQSESKLILQELFKDTPPTKRLSAKRGEAKR